MNLTCSVSSLTSAWTKYLCPSLGVSDPKYPSVTRSDTMRVGWTSLWNRQMNEKPPRFLLRVRSSICRWYSEVVYIFTPFSSCLRERSEKNEGLLNFNMRLRVPSNCSVDLLVGLQSYLSERFHPRPTFDGLGGESFVWPQQFLPPPRLLQTDSWESVAGCENI